MLAMAKKRPGSRHAPRSMISLPKSLYQRLKKIAERNGRPINWEARIIIERDVARQESEPPPPPSD